MRAVYPDARNPHAFPELLREGFEPHTRGARSGWPAAAPDDGRRHHQDLRAQGRRAARATRARSAAREDLEKMVRHWARTTAKAAGLGKGRLAEGFKVVVTS